MKEERIHERETNHVDGDNSCGRDDLMKKDTIYETRMCRRFFIGSVYKTPDKNGCVKHPFLSGLKSKCETQGYFISGDNRSFSIFL